MSLPNSSPRLTTNLCKGSGTTYNLPECYMMVR